MQLAELLEDLTRLEDGAWSDRLLQGRLARELAWSGADRARHVAILRGVIEEWMRHSWVLAARLARRPRPRVRAALRLGLCQLEQGHPDYAVINSLLEQLSDLGSAERGLVNAVLRGLLREDQALAPLPPFQPPSTVEEWTRLGTALSLPEWFLRVVQSHEGRAALLAPRLGALKREVLEGRRLWLRINTSMWSSDEALQDFKQRGLLPGTAPECADFISLGRPPESGLDRFEPLKDGRVRVQDLSAWGALHLLQVQPGQRVLDACAAPGGKSLALLDAHRDIQLVAVEADPGRARALSRRLGTRAELRTGSALEITDEGWDRILLDVPCSGSGTIGHRPEILLKQDPVSRGLLGLQESLLCHAADILKVGGRLVYSTCSLDFRENQNQVKAFLGQRPNFSVAGQLVPEPMRDALGGWCWIPWSRGNSARPGRPGAGGAWAIALTKADSLSPGHHDVDLPA